MGVAGRRGLVRENGRIRDEPGMTAFSCSRGLQLGKSWKDCPPLPYSAKSAQYVAWRLTYIPYHIDSMYSWYDTYHMAFH